MAVGGSRPTLVANKDGFFSIKNEMLVSLFFTLYGLYASKALLMLSD